jgi:hypothetical protein
MKCGWEFGIAEENQGFVKFSCHKGGEGRRDKGE